MTTLTIYHNPRCSKSRQALAWLQEKGYEPQVIEYLKKPLSLNELRLLSSHFPIHEFVRTNEQAFKNANISLNDLEQVLQLIQREPKLMQRPIVTCQDKAVIARPAEKIEALLA